MVRKVAAKKAATKKVAAPGAKKTQGKQPSQALKEARKEIERLNGIISKQTYDIGELQQKEEILIGKLGRLRMGYDEQEAVKMSLEDNYKRVKASLSAMNKFRLIYRMAFAELVRTGKPVDEEMKALLQDMADLNLVVRINR